MHRLAHTDQLTGIANRRQLYCQEACCGEDTQRKEQLKLDQTLERISKPPARSPVARGCSSAALLSRSKHLSPIKITPHQRCDTRITTCTLYVASCFLPSYS
jgi:hypothetical protein